MREHIENTARATATKMQEHIDIACAAATKAVEQVVQQLKQRSNDNDKTS
jgi:hypothetical protein